MLAATAACSDGGNNGAQSAQVPFDNGVRQSWSQPTTCSMADQSCGAGIGNPAVQSPVQKRELGASGEGTPQ